MAVWKGNAANSLSLPLLELLSRREKREQAVSSLPGWTKSAELREKWLFGIQGNFPLDELALCHDLQRHL